LLLARVGSGSTDGDFGAGYHGACAAAQSCISVTQNAMGGATSAY